MKTIIPYRQVAISLLLLGCFVDSTPAHTNHLSHQPSPSASAHPTIPQFTQALLHTMDLASQPLHLSQTTPHTNQVRLEERNGYRYIYANGIPDHSPGTFPNPDNPNTITAQNHSFRVTITPQLSGKVTPIRPTFGVALNGIPFEPGTAEYWNRDRSSGWNYDALSGNINLGLDQHNAHVQPTGAYHYHGLPTGLLQGQAMTLIGYAADGFPVYGQYGYRQSDSSTSDLVAMQSSYRLKTGQRPNGPGGNYDGTFVQDFEYVAGLDSLDECNGRFGVTPEYPAGIYHYYITTMFPFIPRCVKGTADESFQRRPEGLPNNGNKRPDGAPHPPRRPGARPPFPPQ